ncbi:maleylpyruvate isomerase family mycothiol-dependent enzyme [Nocardioides daphniae]|uniref:Maleylpyruvate isomerase family mycothiol-dependent enzyme n=1 Tax=Nocardioides daphniae TaxID=402297 RepID=A0ABQ1Q0W6_9ACTN|nr:maleylpyruvate isomerase family mycothiol-dependent enzyme [Nocardioides daphniae]GGD08697.1 hypothetical protein GCM10007231_04430 [Nocardioides daphniae]
MTNLTPYVDIWWSAIADFTLLLEDLPESAWSLPTDLPGWTVRDVAAHTAHLEHLLSGGAHDDVELGEVPHARGFMGVFTEQGVVARRDRSHDDLIREIRESATATHTALLADGTPDPEAPARDPFGAIGWTSTTLWKNRPLDLWMHEQDVRRAVDLPGHLDTPGARHTVDYLSDSLGLVLAKRAKAAPGTTLRLDVEGRAPRAWVVNDAGRGEELTEVPDAADVRLTFEPEAFILVAGGRRGPERLQIGVEGDVELAQRVLEAMAVTP